MLKIKIDNNLSKETQELFIKAENYTKEGKFLEAITCYDKILCNDELDINTYSEAYLGVYLTWYKYCQSINYPDSELLSDLYYMILSYLPKERKEELDKFHWKDTDYFRRLMCYEKQK